MSHFIEEIPQKLVDRGSSKCLCLTDHDRTAQRCRSSKRCELWREIAETNIEYVTYDHFDNPSALGKITGPTPRAEDTVHERFLKKSANKAPSGIPPYLASLYETPLLTPEQEFHLFRKMNYCNFRADQLRQELSAETATLKELEIIQALLRSARQIRNQIVKANLRLVVSIARRFVEKSNTFDDLVSDGNVTLIRAVEIFDFTRGYRFSTYATWAVRNTFIRLVPRCRQRSAMYVTGAQEMFEGCFEARISQSEYESEHRQLSAMVSGMLACLDNRERTIVMSRFGLDGSGTKKKFREISSQMEISTERVRQIVAGALTKLRSSYAETCVDFAEFHS